MGVDKNQIVQDTDVMKAKCWEGSMKRKIIYAMAAEFWKLSKKRKRLGSTLDQMNKYFRGEPGINIFNTFPGDFNKPSGFRAVRAKGQFTSSIKLVYDGLLLSGIEGVLFQSTNFAVNKGFLSHKSTFSPQC